MEQFGFQYANQTQIQRCLDRHLAWNRARKKEPETWTSSIQQHGQTCSTHSSAVCRLEQKPVDAQVPMHVVRRPENEDHVLTL